MRSWGVAALAVLLVFAGGAAGSANATVAAKSVSTKTLLGELNVGNAYRPGYKRSDFRLWDSTGHGCTVRDEVLLRDAKRRPTVDSGCYLSGGRWVSPYDGIATTDPTDEQIDHVVPLADAWGGGAWRWNAKTRERYANDTGTGYDLLAVSAKSNEDKGDSTPAHWLPPKRSFDCRYMADYVGVMWRWRLTIDSSLKSFLTGHLAACGWPTVVEPARPAIHDGSGSGASSGGGKPAHVCTKTSTGKCIEKGEFCREADYGKTGYDAEGAKLTCTGPDHSHPHWE